MFTKLGCTVIGVSVLSAGLCTAIEMKGVSYTAWSSEALSTANSDRSLADAQSTGCNWIAICVWWFQDTVNSTVIAPDYSRYSASPSSVVHAIQKCHQLGMRVMLKPMVDLRNDPNHWRGQIRPSVAWFASYREFIYFWADVAQTHNVESFCVGCELVATVSEASSWIEIIEEIRENHYSGPITYAANHGNELNVTWWDGVDYIGIDAYYPLTNKNDPTLDELKATWKNICDAIETARNERWPAKDIVFTEVGYQSTDGANRTPWWRDPDTNGIDLQEQVDCYEALLSQCKKRSWWLGAFWWNWETRPDAGGLDNKLFTVQNKPAQQVLRYYYMLQDQNDILRGDSNTDSSLDIADAIYTLSYLFAGGTAPTCLDAADSNDDGAVDIADAIALLSHLFAGSSDLPGPFGDCGIDPTVDELGCESFPPCE